MIVEKAEPAGIGALLKLLAERKEKLEKEGLFAPERKKKIPYLPESIGVVTSPSGAVIRDIMHRLNERFPRPVYLWPVLVQGEGAAEQIASAINGFNNIPEEGIDMNDLFNPDRFKVPTVAELKKDAENLLKSVIRFAKVNRRCKFYMTATGPFKASYRYGIIELECIFTSWSCD